MNSVERSQRALTDRLRSDQPIPASEHRLGVYRRLVFNNIRGFIRNGFPVFREVIGDAGLDRLVAAFIQEHASQTPYFLDIGWQFIDYLASAQLVEALPPFTSELLHWEWIELALDVADEQLPAPPASRVLNPGSGLQCSPLMHLHVGQFPVHRINRDHQPTQPSPKPVCLVAWRGRDEVVHFMELTPAAARIVELYTAPGASVEQVCDQLADEAGAAASSLLAQVIKTSQQLFDRDILLPVSDRGPVV